MIAHYSLLTFITVILITSIFLTIFECEQVAPVFDVRLYANWTHSPSCLPFTSVIKGLNALHIVSDALLLVAPISMLWSVQMKLNTKFRVWIAGLVGCVNIILSICRINANDTLDKGERFCKFSLY